MSQGVLKDFGVISSKECVQWKQIVMGSWYSAQPFYGSGLRMTHPYIVLCKLNVSYVCFFLGKPISKSYSHNAFVDQADLPTFEQFFFWDCQVKLLRIMLKK